MSVMKVFISYKRQHPATTAYLHQIEPALESAGFRLVWSVYQQNQHHNSYSYALAHKNTSSSGVICSR